MTKKNTGNDILTGVIYKQILIYFFPILLGSFLQQLYNTADAVIVGKFANKEGLAAIGATNYIINILIGFFIGLAAGGTVVISQFYGGGRNKELRRAVHTTIALGILCGILVMVFGILFSPMALKVMNTPSDVFDFALLYLRVYFLGAIPVVLYNVGTGILMAVGDTKSPLYVLIACTIANIVLDLIFVALMGMGIFGAALATALSQLLSAVLILLILMRTELSYKLRLKKIRFHKDMLMEILKIGLPTGFQSTLFFISNIIIQSAVNLFGTDTVAAWTAVIKIDNLYWMVITALGISITTFVGQNFGAGNFSRIHEGVKVTLYFSAFVSILLSIVFYFWCEPLLRIFTDDPAVIEAGIHIFRHYCQYFILFIAIEILSGAIRGVGVTFMPTVITALGICFLRIAWVLFVVPHNRTVENILFCYPLTWFITSVIFIIYYLHGGWLRKRKKAMGF